MGRNKIRDITQREWFQENIEQVDSENSEWDHLIWTGPGISRHNAPRVTSPNGSRNVRRVLWTELKGEVLPTGLELVPDCGEDHCVSPRHAAVITQAEAAKGRRREMLDEQENMPSPNKPWLKVGRAGGQWTDFTEPLGQTAATIAFMIWKRASKVETGKGLVRVDVHELHPAALQCCWDNWAASSQLFVAVDDILDSRWLIESAKIMQSINSPRGAIKNVDRFYRMLERLTGEHAWYLDDSDDDQFIKVIRKPADRQKKEVADSIPDPSGFFRTTRRGAVMPPAIKS